MGKKVYRALIADDEAVSREALTSQLQTIGHEVVGAAEDGDEAVRLAKEVQPDVRIIVHGACSSPEDVSLVEQGIFYYMVGQAKSRLIEVVEAAAHTVAFPSAWRRLPAREDRRRNPGHAS